MNNYETVFILNPVLAEDQTKETVKKIEDYLTSNNAKIVNKEKYSNISFHKKLCTAG